MKPAEKPDHMGDKTGVDGVWDGWARRREEVLRPLKVARQRAQGGIDLGAEEAENLRRRCRLHCPEFYPRPPSPANAPQPQLQ